MPLFYGFLKMNEIVQGEFIYIEVEINLICSFMLRGIARGIQLRPLTAKPLI